MKGRSKKPKKAEEVKAPKAKAEKRELNLEYNSEYDLNPEKVIWIYF